MLGVANYSKEMIATCWTALDRQLELYDAMAKTADPEKLADFAPVYFETLVVALDHYFMHRLRKVEGKDGNPMNEVRMLVVSILENGGVMKADNTIKYVPGRSITGIAVGGRIVLDRETFGRLAEAYFQSIEQTFS